MKRREIRKNMRHKLEIIMGRMGAFIADHPFKVIVVILMFSAFPLSYVPQIKMDTSAIGFLHNDDPALLEYNAFREEFGSDERVIVALKSDDIFTLKFLEILRTIYEDLETNLPFLDDITSLYNVRNTRGEGDKLVTDNLLEDFPQTEEQVEAIKKEALASHFYKDLFISSDGKMTAIVIEADAFNEGSLEEVTDESKERAFLTDKENTEFIETVLEITNKYKQEGIDIYIAGSPSMNNALKPQIQRDMQKFMPITFFIIIIFLFVMFRRVSAVVYPAIVIILSLLVTVGAMAWAGVAFKLPTQIVPSLLMVVSVGATVHTLSIFFDRLNATGNKKEAIRDTFVHSGLAIVMASVAIVIGVGSFAGSEVVPISDLGIYASLGVIVSLFLTLTLLPALLSITKLKPKMSFGADKLDKIMKKLSAIPIRHYKSIIIISTILLALALTSAMKIVLSHNPVSWFTPNTHEHISAEAIDEKLNGLVTIELVVDSKKENGWNDSVRLEKLNKLSEDMEKYVDKYTHIGKVVSLATIVKETNRALHENKETHYTIPKNADLVSQELFLLESSGSDDLEDVVDSRFSQTRISIMLHWTDVLKAMKVLTYVKEEVSKTFPEDTVVITGMAPLLINIFTHTVDSTVSSYFKAFIGITFMMMFVLGTFRLGLISMIPGLASIVLGLLIMYVANIPLDIFTLLIGSIAIALAADNTIHFMHNFKRYYVEDRDSTKAIEQTFHTTGKAMVIATTVLSFGFYAYMMANEISVQNFGLLAGSITVLVLLTNLLLTPALMIIIAKRGWIR